MTKLLVLNAGHGGNDSGALSGGLKEKDLTLDIAKRVRSKLSKYDLKVIMTRATDKYHTLTEIANIANRNKADLFVSVHINSGGGTGFESFIYNGDVSSNTHKLQNNIHDNIMNQLDVADRGKKRANFAVVRQTTMPAVLTENLFIDGDNSLLKKDSILNDIAQGHADGIAEYLGLKKGKAESKPSAPPKKESKPTKGKSISKMASEVIAGKHGSGHANRRKSLGISKSEYEKVRAEVNKRAGSTSKPAPKKSLDQMVNEVLKGQHGNGHVTRQKSLGINNSEYRKVKSEVNKRLMGKVPNKSISQMATEVIQGKHGTGHANRRKSLSISQAQYNKVRAEVNKRL